MRNKIKLTSIARAGSSADDVVGFSVDIIESVEVTGSVVAFPSEVGLSLLY